jgi:hypothetical protein
VRPSHRPLSRSAKQAPSPPRIARGNEGAESAPDGRSYRRPNTYGMFTRVCVAYVILHSAPAASVMPHPPISPCFSDLETPDRFRIIGNVSNGAFVPGQQVVFGGILAAYNLSATVNTDGSFGLSFTAPGLQHGHALGQVVDPNGATGNVSEVNYQ